MRILTVVNDKNEVIGFAEHKDVYEKKLSHRIVHILVFNNEGKMALHLRSKKREYMPLYWVTAAGGHVERGEEYEEAAKRELKEELGIEGELEFLFKDYYIGEQEVGKFLQTYKIVHDGPFDIGEEEVDRADFFSLEEIKEMLDKGEKFHPELLFILKKYYEIK